MENRDPKAESRRGAGGEAPCATLHAPCHASFPIRQSEEHAVSRRQFAAFCGCSAVALAAGVPLKEKLLAMPDAGEAIAVATLDDPQPGAAVLFNYPTGDHPCILVRLSESEWVAYSAACTHLMCPVHFDPGANQLVCPCHKGFFDVKNGFVVAGPPRRALPRYEVNVVDGRILVGPKRIANEPDLS